MTGDPEQIEQTQSEYNEADYAKKQAEYQKAMADAQNSAQEVSDAEKNLKEVMKHGTPEEKAAAKQRLKEAKANQKDALKRLKSFDTGKAVRSASPDYSNPQSSNESGEKGEQEKPEIKDTASGTFDAFEALGQNYDWQKTNGEKQLHTLVDIRSLLQQQQDGMYI